MVTPTIRTLARAAAKSAQEHNEYVKALDEALREEGYDVEAIRDLDAGTYVDVIDYGNGGAVDWDELEEYKS